MTGGPGPGRLRLLARIPFDTTFRRSLVLRLLRPQNLFQPFNDTSEDRYPDVFAFLAERLAPLAAPAILSFGCSTGAEVFSLRRYLPAAELTGLDISRANIADGRRRLRRNPDPGTRFVLGGDASAFGAGSFDAVLCMAVFRHGDLSRPGTTSCAHRITFESFERTLGDLDRVLRPGGYLAVANSNFRFADTRLSSGYEVVLRQPAQPDPRTPVFDERNTLVPATAYGEVVFVKRRTSAHR